MRVIVVSDQVWPKGGGGELATHLHLQSLMKKGFKINLYAKDLPSYLSLPVKRIKFIGEGKYVKYSKTWKRNFLKDISSYDVAYFTGCFDLLPDVKALGIPTVVHLHSYYPLCPVGHLYNFVSGRPCVGSNFKRGCTRCIFSFERDFRGRMRAFISAILNSYFGNKFLEYVVMSNHILFVSKLQKEIVEEISGFSGEVVRNPLPKIRLNEVISPNIGYLGGINPIKGYHLLIRAWNRLNVASHKAMLKIAGEGKVSLSMFHGNIEYIGKVRYENLEDFYSTIKGVVIPSLAPETLPYTAVEASLAGRPLVITEMTGFADEVGSISPGVQVVKRDERDLAESLKWLISLSPEEAFFLGKKNREAVIELHSWENTTGKLISILKDVSRL